MSEERKLEAIMMDRASRPNGRRERSARSGVATALIFMEPGRFESDFARVTREAILCGLKALPRSRQLGSAQYPYAG
jgi:hypothetical protein